MPPKKRSRFGSRNTRAEEARERRDAETPEQREERLLAERIRKHNYLLVESSEQTSDILLDVASTSRQRESSQQNSQLESIVGDIIRLDAGVTINQSQRELTNTFPEQSITETNYVPSRRWSVLNKVAFNYDSQIDYNHFCLNLNIGGASCICRFCGAKKWVGETLGMCCSSGKVSLIPLQEPPPALKSLMENQQFIKKIRTYNSAFQMTSFGTTRPIRTEGYMPTFRIQGQIYHQHGSLLPVTGEHKFLQIYFMGGDSDLEVDRRHQIHANVDRQILSDLQGMFHECNNLIRSFKYALERLPEDNMRVVIRADRPPAGEHAGRYNAPIHDEVAVVMEGNEFGSRDIIICKKDNTLRNILDTHRSYDALQYPIIFPYGEDGYCFSNFQINPNTRLPTNKKVSAMDFYAYRIMMRSENNHILQCSQLFNQFIVDMYVKIESERLLYIKNHQSNLRSEQYIHLRDAIATDGDPTHHGQLVILPSSFVGSPRYMHEHSQDAMTYVRNFGRPDFFITFTCNPKWLEIDRELYVSQKVRDRSDLAARVFREKLKKLIDSITKGEIFGSVRAWVYSVEWQKRGLPHAHILIWLSNRLVSTDIDKLISAEIPDRQSDEKLFDVVTKSMIHGPCGNINLNSPCMKDGKCSKRYPRALVSETQTDRDGYPLYRRRGPGEGGNMTRLTVRINNSHVDLDIDNRWVVPYSPLLCKIFNAHINVEFCNSVKAIKYVCKYVCKGSDQAVFGLQADGHSIDEIDGFRSGRYVGTNEAVWRILSFPIHQRHPTVVHLQVHLENGQRIYFTEDNLTARLDEPQRTTLMGFFDLCTIDSFAKTLLYHEVPKYYTWNTSSRKFNRRKQGTPVPGVPGIKASDALGRVYGVHPNNHECYFLRLLLHAVVGPTSFVDLKTFNGVICQTFREACLKRGLLEDDTHYFDALREADFSESPSKIRHLFCIIISFCEISDPRLLFETFKDSMSQDILHSLNLIHEDILPSDLHYINNQLLIILERHISKMTGKHLNDYTLDSPDYTITQTRTFIDSSAHDDTPNIPLLQQHVLITEPLLLPDQNHAYTSILNSVESNLGDVFFLDAPGGTGKTFLLNLLLSKLRSNSKTAIAVASSGIAATLLENGRTAHSTLQIPLNLFSSDFPTCAIAKGTAKARLLQQCSLLVWDECTMIHKLGLEAVDRTLRDIRGSDKLMGGMVVVLAGDFRQTLPIVQKGTMVDEINACLKTSDLWKHVKPLRLQTNMRAQLQSDTDASHFSSQLLSLGNGEFPEDPTTHQITFPLDFCIFSADINDLISQVFPNLHQNYSDQKWLCERAILATKNECVDLLNITIQSNIPGPATDYFSIDTVIDSDNAVEYPVEFLNSLNINGLPTHKISLKVGSPIMLMRNLNPPRLCNGTRLCVKSLGLHVIEATILTGCGKGETIFIPRIPLIPTDSVFPFRRLQFPIRLSFSMTINKSQGQTFGVVGLDLRQECFSHGQLYVAASRVGSSKNLFILTTDDRKTRNVVYKRVLNS